MPRLIASPAATTAIVSVTVSQPSAVDGDVAPVVDDALRGRRVVRHRHSDASAVAVASQSSADGALVLRAHGSSCTPRQQQRSESRSRARAAFASVASRPHLRARARSTALSTWKKSASVKPKAPATRFDGNDSTAVL